MISFLFTVNRSFLEYPTHPVTVPRSRVDYAQLRREGLGPSLTIVAPTGQTVTGRLYSGIAGYGHYYQIQADGHRGDPLYELPLGACLRVEVARGDMGTVVRLHNLGA